MTLAVDRQCAYEALKPFHVWFQAMEWVTPDDFSIWETQGYKSVVHCGQDQSAVWFINNLATTCLVFRSPCVQSYRQEDVWECFW